MKTLYYSLVLVALALLPGRAHAGPLDRQPYGQTIRAETLAQAYQKNPISADQLYKGKVFKIGGRVKNIDTDEAVIVEFETAPSRELYGIRCTFANTAGVAALRVGKPAQITGTVEGKRGYRLLITNCTL